MEEHLDQGLILDEPSLAWQRYDEIMRAMDRVEDQYDLSAGMERFNPQKFKRDLTVFRIGHFASRIVELGPKIELPTGSILHLLDDVAYSEHSDVPRLEENVFVQHESFKKYIYHVRDFDLAEGPITLDEKYIYRTAGLPRVLMSFRSNHGNKYKYINTLAEVPTRKEALVIINHNPLFRVTLYGRLQYFRKIQLILASVLNTVHRLTHLDKQQFIMIPWGTEIFEKSLFVRSRKALTPFTVRYPGSFHYIVMMHLVNFMWNDAQTSFLDKLPEEDLAQINLVLNCSNKYVFYNLADLKAMNAKNAAHMRFVNQLNMLSVLGRPEVNKDRLSDHFTKVDITDDEDTVSAAYEVKSERQQYPVDTPVNPEPERLTPEDLGENSSDAEVAEENRVERVITHAAKVIPAAVKQAVTKVSTALPRANTVETRLVAGATSRVAVTAKTTNSSNPTSADKSSDKQDVTRRYLQEQETLADEFIMKQPTLTPRQKERCKILARKYRDLELHGVKLSKILSTQDDIELDDAPLTEEMLGIEAPDKAALTYSPRAYDNSYLKKTSDKHFVGAINSFQRNGVFLVGIKENKVVSELNNYTEYTLQYEDWEGKKSSIKVKLPTVNREGKVVIDGIPKVLRKQRVTLPIVKTSDTTVSLSSNYNKTQVIRNTTKAHNYFSYIDGLVNSSKSKAVVIYGNCVIRDVPLAYEYTQLADKYKSLEWDDWKLWFDYKNRAEHFDGTEERLAKLEAQYGTYFGRQGKVNLFIDEQNEVHAITTTGSDDPEFPYRSIFDICKTSLNEGAKYDKPLTEWVSIKILDKMLPVMFLLSYRYGLRHTLDYLGVNYTITEGRSKVILGESGVAGNESIGSSRYPAPEQLTDRLLQVVGHKVKLQMKALYHFDVDNVELKVSRQNYYDNGKPCNTDAYNAWAGCYVRTTNTVYINEQFAAVMRNWFAEQVVYYDNYVRFLYWMVAHELTHSCYGNVKYAGTFNKVEAAAKNKNFTTVYLEGISKTAPNYREELCCEYVASSVKQITVGNESFGAAVPGMEGLSLAELGQLAGNLISPVNSFMEAIKFSTPFSYIWTTGSEVDTVGKRIRFKSIELWDFDAGRFMRRQRAGRLDEVAGKWYPIKLPKQLDLLHHASFGDIVQIADIESMIPDFFKEVRALVKRRGYAVINNDLRFTFRSGIHHRLVALAEKSGTRITRNKVFIPEEFHGNKSIIGTASFGAGIDNILDVGGVVDDKYFGTDWIKFKNDDEEAGTEDANERRYVPKPGDVPIKFADRVLWINRYPLAKSLIVCGLGGMNTEDYEMAAFESPDIYYQVLMDQGLSINYLKGIDSFFDLFIDNMTYSVLESMHEPTNVRDLLIRCAVLLSTTDHRPPSSRANHRIRGYEQFNAVVYNEMARQFAAYQSRRGAGNKFSVNPNAIYLRVVSNASLVPSECPNPLQDMKEQAAMTYAGAGGRTSESFVVEDRKFSHDDIGVVSEATVDNGKVGINAQLAFNAGIVDTEGTLAQPDELSAGNVLSATAVMFPFATRDDRLLSGYGAICN